MVPVFFFGLEVNFRLHGYQKDIKETTHGITEAKNVEITAR